MDGNRSLADGRDLPESEIHRIIQSASIFDPRSNIVISDDDYKTSDVGSQDETSKEGTLGDSV